MNIRTLLALAMVAVPFSLAGAQTYTPVSLIRAVRSYVIVPGCSPNADAEVKTSTEFDPFVESVQVTLGCQGRLAHADGAMDSLLLPGAIFAAGEAISQGDTTTAWTIHSIAESDLQLVFDVPVNSRFVALGQLSTLGGVPVRSIQPVVALTRVNGPVIFDQFLDAPSDGSAQQESFEVEGGLPAGRYRLIANARTLLDATISGGVMGRASFSIYLTIKEGCTADLNADGFVNGDDYDLFASFFDAADSRADFNRDGFVNGNDYDEFAAAFDSGC